MNNALMFSTASDEWSTPQETFDRLDGEFDFQIDLAATAHNTKCREFYTKETDALLRAWHMDEAVGWLNPPYSKCQEFIGKAAMERCHGFTTVCLVPARTDTRWWHAHVWGHGQTPTAGRRRSSFSKGPTEVWWRYRRCAVPKCCDRLPPSVKELIA